MKCRPETSRTSLLNLKKSPYARKDIWRRTHSCRLPAGQHCGKVKRKNDLHQSEAEAHLHLHLSILFLNLLSMPAFMWVEARSIQAGKPLRAAICYLVDDLAQQPEIQLPVVMRLA